MLQESSLSTEDIIHLYERGRRDFSYLEFSNIISFDGAELPRIVFCNSYMGISETLTYSARISPMLILRPLILVLPI